MYQDWEAGSGVTALGRFLEGADHVLEQTVVTGVALTIGKPPECTFRERVIEMHITVQFQARVLGLWCRPEISVHRGRKPEDC